MNQTKIKAIDDLISVHVKGYVRYTFEDSDDTDQRFVELVSSLNEESDEADINHLIYQQHEISYILDHFLHRRLMKKDIMIYHYH